MSLIGEKYTQCRRATVHKLTDSHFHWSRLLLLLLLYSLRFSYWVSTSLLKSPGLFSVFQPLSIILSFGWSRFVIRFPTISSSFLRVPITMDITVNHMFHSFLSSLARSKYMYLYSLSLIFILRPPERQSLLDHKFSFSGFFFFFFFFLSLIIIESGRN